MEKFELNNTPNQKFEATKEALKKGDIESALKWVLWDTWERIKKVDDWFKEKIHIAELIKRDQQECCDIISSAFKQLPDLVLQTA